MGQEFEREIVIEPKSFAHTFEGLRERLRGHEADKRNDKITEFLRQVRHEHALSMLSEANRAYLGNQVSAAWYYLAEAAEAIGFLTASQGAIYPRGDDGGLRESLAESGKIGGIQKGVNAKALQDKIAAELVRAAENGWENKTAMRRKYNAIIDELDDYRDPDRKWRKLLMRKDIQESLSKGSKK